MTKSFRVTPRAQQDLKDIGRYTKKTWGVKQRNRYLRKLDERFAWLASHLELGKHRSDVHEGYYSYPEGSHIIFFIIRDGGIDIIGVPHKNMDILIYFTD